MTETAGPSGRPAPRGRVGRLFAKAGRAHLMLLTDTRPIRGERGLRFGHLHALGYGALIAAAVLRLPAVAGIALLYAAAVEAGALLLPGHGERSPTEWRRGIDDRSPRRVLLFILALATGGAPAAELATFAAMALVVSTMSRLMRSDALKLGTTSLLRPLGGLETGAERMRRAMKLAWRRDVSDLPLQAALLVAGFLLTMPQWTAAVSSGTAVVAGSVLVIGAVGLVGVAALQCRAMRPEMLLRHDDEVIAAFREFDPEVICYFNGHPGSTYAVDTWLRTFENCGRRVALVYRHRSVESVDTDMLPGVMVPRDATVEKLVTPSTRVALYPANSTLNVHLQRDKRLSHVFIGHGDSDKAGSASPFTRSYDQVWVSGPAAIARYEEAGVHIPADRFVCIGRPPLSPVVRAAGDDHRAARFAAAGEPDPVDMLRAELAEVDGDERPTTILYAPTWEGYFEDSDYSSLESMGMEIVEALLDLLPECRIVFKPHPMTGYRKKHLADLSHRIREKLAHARTHHPSTAVHSGVDLHTWFDITDLLIADVSSVVSDFLAWDRPLVVTNPLGMPIEEFRRRFPTSTAAYVVEPGSPTVSGVVASALEEDPLRPRRLESMRLFLGDDGRDPMDRFVDAVDALYESTEPRSD